MDAKKKKKFFVSILLALLAAALVSAAVRLAPASYETFELKTLDLRFKLRPPVPQRQDILFTEIDAPAIQDLGRWPWPRETFARILETLEGLKAKAVIFDVLFSEPSQLIVDKKALEESLRLKENQESLQGFIGQALNDAQAGQFSAEKAQNALTQLKDEAAAWEKDISQTLSSAMQDNDLLLADGIKNAGNVYLSGHFEIAPPEKKPKKYASAEAVKAKLVYLLQRNLDLTLEDALPYLPDANPGLVRQYYSECRAQVYKEEVEAAFQNSNQVSLEELTARLGIFNSGNIKLLAQVYGQIAAQKAFSQKCEVQYSGKQRFYQALNLAPPIMPFIAAMKSGGHFNVLPDGDGALRKVPLFVRYQGKIYPHISLRVACDILGVDLQKDMRIQPGRSITIGSRRIPVDTQGCLLLNWAGKWFESYGHLSISEVYRLWELGKAVDSGKQLLKQSPQDESLMETVNTGDKKLQELKTRLAALINGKICIIGLTAAGTHDHFPMPLDHHYPGVGVHANLINSLLEGKFLTRADAGTNYALIALLALISAFFAAVLTPAAGLLCVSLMVILYCGVTFLVFCNYGLWIDLVGPCLSGLVSYAGITSYSFAVEKKERRWVEKAFGHYISKNVMQEILKDPSKLKLGGEAKELSILFTDVRSFTTYTEKHPPQEVVFVLNDYLDEMTKVVFKHDGTIDKYVGDEIMAIFGAPSYQPDHAARAVTVALEMLERLRMLQDKWRSAGIEPIDIGIGINTGSVIIGNMGSAECMSYTVIGDPVNLASRIQTLTRRYNNHIMISEFTYALVKDLFEVKPLEAIQVKGKEQLVVMYEVLGVKAKPDKA